jgi:hypothetical protein
MRCEADALAHDQRQVAQVIAVMLAQVEGEQHRLLAPVPCAIFGRSRATALIWIMPSWHPFKNDK